MNERPKPGAGRTVGAKAWIAAAGRVASSACSRYLKWISGAT
jgi:hypothetical protein